MSWPGIVEIGEDGSPGAVHAFCSEECRAASPVEGSECGIGAHDVVCETCGPARPDLRPVVQLERNNAGDLFVSVVEFDQATSLATRSAVLVHQGAAVSGKVMHRRYADLVRLMGDNVRTRHTFEEGEVEHDVASELTGWGRNHPEQRLERLTCRTCGGATLVRQFYMSGADWHEQRETFVQAHPGNMTIDPA